MATPQDRLPSLPTLDEFAAPPPASPRAPMTTAGSAGDAGGGAPLPDLSEFAAAEDVAAASAPPSVAAPTKPRSYGAREAFQPAGAAWSIEHADQVKQFYRDTFGRDLPVSAFGQSRTHDRMGLDHSHSMDVAVNPTSREGQQLLAHLRANNIPFLAYDRPVPGAATNAHIHIGHASHGLGAARRSVSGSGGGGGGMTASSLPASLPTLDEFATEAAAPSDAAVAPAARALPDLSEFATDAATAPRGDATTDDDGDEIVRVNARPAVAAPEWTPEMIMQAGDAVRQRHSEAAQRLTAARQTNQSPDAPPQRAQDARSTFDPYTEQGRAARDAQAAAEARPDARRMMDVRLPVGVGGWDELSSNDAARATVRQFAAERGIDPQFVEGWLQQRGGPFRWYDRSTGEEVTPLELIGSDAYDPERRTLRVSAELPHLKELEADYQASKGTLTRAAEWATDDQTTAGEKFLDVVEPVAGAAGRATDLATRPLQASSTALWSLARQHSPAEAVADAWHKLRTGETPEGAGNYLAEQVAQSETLKAINPNLPGMLGGVVEVLTDPSNLAPLGVLARGGMFLRGVRGVREVESALMASRDARVTEFFNAGGRVLRLEAAPASVARSGAEAATAATAASADASGLLVTIKDPHGNLHRFNTATGELEENVNAPAPTVGGMNAPELSERYPQTMRALPRHLESAERRALAFEEQAATAANPEHAAEAAEQAAKAHDDADHIRRIMRSLDDYHAAVVAMDDPVPSSGVDAASAATKTAGIRPRSYGARAVGAARAISSVVNIPKAALASFDASGIFRPGVLLWSGRPERLKEMLAHYGRSMASEDAYHAFRESVLARGDLESIRKSGLHLATLGNKEEAFGSSLTQRIPGVKQSERGYNAGLDSLRLQTWEHFSDELAQVGVTRHNDPETFKALARHINILSGRGLQPKTLTGKAVVEMLNLPLFSPNLLVARFQSINPVRYALMPPALRRVAAKEAMRSLTSLSAVAGLATLAGVRVGMNPLKGDFLKFQIGNTSYDPTSSESGAVRYAARMAYAFEQQAAGKQVPPEDSPRALTEHYLRSQLSPAAGVAVDWKTGTDFNGNEFKWSRELADHAIPLVVQDLYQGWRAAGAAGVAAASPAIVGVGVHTQEQRAAPIKPTLSARTQAELDRLKLNLDHLGAKGKTSASVRLGYGMNGITGDTVQPFGGGNAGLGMDADATAKQLSDELESALSDTINAKDYADFADDAARRKYLEQVIVNTQRRVMNSVRVGARTMQMDEEKKVKARQDQLEDKSHTKGVRHFNL